VDLVPGEADPFPGRSQMWQVFRRGDATVAFGAVYLPPSWGAVAVLRELRVLAARARQYRTAGHLVVLIGDFNARMGLMGGTIALPRVYGEPLITARGRVLAEWLLRHRMAALMVLRLAPPGTRFVWQPQYALAWSVLVSVIMSSCLRIRSLRCGGWSCAQRSRAASRLITTCCLSQWPSANPSVACPKRRGACGRTGGTIRTRGGSGTQPVVARRYSRSRTDISTSIPSRRKMPLRRIVRYGSTASPRSLIMRCGLWQRAPSAGGV
jgi:hypothetical protein